MRSLYCAVVMLSPLLFWTACGEDPPPPEPIIRPVRFAQVYATQQARTRLFSGTARAALESQLSFKVPGTISRILVDVGDKVKAGTLIADLDDRDFLLQMQEAKANLASAQAQARNAEANYLRVQALWENNNASRSDLDAARATHESAHEQVTRAAKGLELAQSKLSYTRLKAPAAGAIAQVNAEINENINAGKPVVLLTSNSKLEVEVAVPEKLIAQIHQGDSVKVHFDALPGKQFSANITEVGVSVTGAATTFPVIALLDHQDAACRPGMSTEVEFRFGGDQKSFFVRPAVVSEDRQGRFVYVVEPGADGLGKVHRRPVQTGELSDVGLEITDGLNDGDRVITAGMSRLIDDQQVRLLEE